MYGFAVLAESSENTYINSLSSFVIEIIDRVGKNIKIYF